MYPCVLFIRAPNAFKQKVRFRIKKSVHNPTGPFTRLSNAFKFGDVEPRRIWKLQVCEKVGRVASFFKQRGLTWDITGPYDQQATPCQILNGSPGLPLRKLFCPELENFNAKSRLIVFAIPPLYEPFHNFWAPRSGDQLTLFASFFASRKTVEHKKHREDRFVVGRTLWVDFQLVRDTSKRVGMSKISSLEMREHMVESAYYIETETMKYNLSTKWKRHWPVRTSTWLISLNRDEGNFWMLELTYILRCHTAFFQLNCIIAEPTYLGKRQRLTGLFIIFEPQDQEIGEFLVTQKCRPRDFEAPSCVRVGRAQQWYALHHAAVKTPGCLG